MYRKIICDYIAYSPELGMYKFEAEKAVPEPPALCKMHYCSQGFAWLPEAPRPKKQGILKSLLRYFTTA